MCPVKSLEIKPHGIIEHDDRIEVVILAERTIEKSYGWVFRYQSKKYVESKEMRDMLIGNCPILVTKSGELVLLPTSVPVEESIRRYELGLPLLQKRGVRRS